MLTTIFRIEPLAGGVKIVIILIPLLLENVNGALYFKRKETLKRKPRGEEENSVYPDYCLLRETEKPTFLIDTNWIMIFLKGIKRYVSSYFMFCEINIPPYRVLIVIRCDFIISNLILFIQISSKPLSYSLYSVGKEVKNKEDTKSLLRGIGDLKKNSKGSFFSTRIR